MGVSLKGRIEKSQNVGDSSTVSLILVYFMLFLMRWVLEKAKK